MGFDQKQKTDIEYPWWVPQAAQTELDISREQLENVRRQQRFQEEQFARLPGELSTEQAAREAAATGAEGLLETTRDLIERQAEAVSGGVAATPEQRQLIRQAADAAIRTGEADIERALERTGTILREEVSPSLGMRPGSSPILDRADQARAEAIQQQGQLVRGVRGAEAQQLLGFPLQAGAFETQRSATTASMSEATRQFQQQLQQQAFQNRLLLTGQTGQQSLQLASLGGNVPIVSSGSTTTVRDPLGQTATLFGGVGGLLTGVGDLRRG